MQRNPELMQVKHIGVVLQAMHCLQKNGNNGGQGGMSLCAFLDFFGGVGWGVVSWHKAKAMVEEDRHDDHWHHRRSRRASRGRRARWPRRWWGRRPRRGPTCLSV